MGERISAEKARELMEAATTTHPGVQTSGIARGHVVTVLRPRGDILVCAECGEYVHSRASSTCTAYLASIETRAGIRALEDAAPDLAATVIARDADIAALRAELAAARVGVVTAEVHARAVRDAYAEGRHDAPEDYWRASPRRRDRVRMWAASNTRFESIATLRASGLDDARAVALADGEVSDG